MTEIDKDALESTWPPMKKALWDVVTKGNLNTKYVNAWELTEQLYAAYLAASPVPVVDDAMATELVQKLRAYLPQTMPDKAVGHINTSDIYSFESIAKRCVETLQAALPLPKEAYVAATLDEVGGAREHEFKDEHCVYCGMDEMVVKVEAHLATPSPVDAEPVARFSVVSFGNIGGENHIIREMPDGDYVKFTDHQASLEAVQAERDALRKANDSYSFLGRDGKTVLAKDLQARAEAAEARLAPVVDEDMVTRALSAKPHNSPVSYFLNPNGHLRDEDVRELMHAALQAALCT